MELPSSGGAGGIGGNYPGSKDRERGGTPPSRHFFNVFRPLRLTLGNVYTMSRHRRQDLVRSSKWRAPQGKISSISAVGAPRGDYEALEGGGGVSQRFPPSSGGLRPFASHCSHRTNRRWASLVAAAQPRIATARGGGRSYGISRIYAATLEGVHVPSAQCVDHCLSSVSGMATLMDRHLVPSLFPTPPI